MTVILKQEELISAKQNKINKQCTIGNVVAWAGQMRGAIMLSLIFFVSFFHQGKKEKNKESNGPWKGNPS